MKRFKVGDRVRHKFLGDATVKKCLRSAMDNKHIFAYIIQADKKPDVRYNTGQHECLVFIDSLESL